MNKKGGLIRSIVGFILFIVLFASLFGLASIVYHSYIQDNSCLDSIATNYCATHNMTANGIIYAYDWVFDCKPNNRSLINIGNRFYPSEVNQCNRSNGFSGFIQFGN